MLASDEDGSTLEALKFSLASDIIELVVLTADQAFLQTLRDAAGVARRVWHVMSPDKVSDLLVAGEVGIVVLDAQALRAAACVFVEQIKRQFPDLVVVAAGRRGDEVPLAGLISAGLVYRFIHKPMSPARAKLFADAAIKKYEDQRRRAAESPRRRRTSPPRGLWLIGGAVAALALIAVAFVLHRSGGDEESAFAPSGAISTDTPEATLLARASAALAANKLTEPPGDNALELYLSLRARNPSNINARAGLDEVHERLLARAENALLQERLDEAATAIETARKSGVESGRIAFLTAQLTKAREQLRSVQTQARALAQSQSQTRIQSQAQMQPQAPIQPPAQVQPQPPAQVQSPAPVPPQPEIQPAPQVQDQAQAQSPPRNAQILEPERESDAWGQLLKNANERLLQDRLVEPANDSAKYFYLSLKQTDSSNPALGPLLQDLGTRLTAKARRSLILGQNDAAKNWADEAESVGFASAELNSVQRDVEVALAKQNFMSNLIPSSQLTVIKTVQPSYPSKAESKKIEGWVDVEFTVSEAGKVTDVVVRAASAPGMFDEAAVKAVSQWRYKPVLRNAKPVPVRTQLRIRFLEN